MFLLSLRSLANYGGCEEVEIKLEKTWKKLEIFCSEKVAHTKGS